MKDSISDSMKDSISDSMKDSMPDQETMDKMMEQMNPETEDNPNMNEMMEMMKQMMGPQNYGSAKDLPKIATHNFIEIENLVKVSRFRGGYGHDYSFGSGEKCRSMKHYFWYKGEPGKPHNPKWMSIKYFAPANGTIKQVQTTTNKYGKEAQFHLESLEHKNIAFVFHHVALASGLSEGSKVNAGQYLGIVGDENAHGEIGLRANTLQLFSIFEVMSKEVLDEYLALGLDLEEVIISKEERDANPLNCDYSTEEGRFVGYSEDGLRDSSGLDNFVELN